MKTIKNITLLAFVFLLAMTGCKKENEFGGDAKITGTVSYKGTPVTGAVVQLALGATEPTTTFGASTVSDGNGSYTFNGLAKGDYYVTATYKNATGQTFVSGGAKVKIGDKKATVTADLAVE